MTNKGRFMPLCSQFVGPQIDYEKKWCDYASIEPHMLHSVFPKNFLKELDKLNNLITNITMCSNHKIIHICQRSGDTCDSFIDMNGVSLCSYTMQPLCNTEVVTFETFSSYLSRKNLESLKEVTEEKESKAGVPTTSFTEAVVRKSLHEESLLDYPCNYETFHILRSHLFGFLIQVFPLTEDNDIYDLFCNIYRVLELDDHAIGSLDLIRKCMNDVLSDIKNGQIICVQKEEKDTHTTPVIPVFEIEKRKGRREHCVRSVLKNHLFHFYHKYRLKEKGHYNLNVTYKRK